MFSRGRGEGSSYDLLPDCWIAVSRNERAAVLVTDGGSRWCRIDTVVIASQQRQRANGIKRSDGFSRV